MENCYGRMGHRDETVDTVIGNGIIVMEEWNIVIGQWGIVMGEWDIVIAQWSTVM